MKRIPSIDEIRQEFLKYAPAYAQKEAAAAIDKVHDLQLQGIIRNGIYYIVLVDLVGSTKYSTEHGNDALAGRIQTFVTASFESLNEIPLRNIGLFVKEIGDAVLYIFQHFPDVLMWRANFEKLLSTLSTAEPIILRTCIHVGEVSLQGVNPLSLAVSQVFKMEKDVDPKLIVLTDPAYNVAWPTLAKAHYNFENYKSVTLDGYKAPVMLHKLIVQNATDITRMLNESLD